MPVRRNAARYEHLLAFALEHPWAVTDSMRTIIAGILAQRMAGEEADEDTLAMVAEMRAAREHAVATGGMVAVIPIPGVIAPRMNALTEISGGTSFELLTRQLRAAVADPNVRSIVFDVDSPGGNVAGATEFAREVMKARTQKTIFAQANHLMASAAYWPMAGATEVIATPSSLVGSIGVSALHDDISEMLSKMGIKREVFSAGKFKAEGADGGPLPAEARIHIQALIDGAYGRFIGDVAKGRGVTAATVRSDFGEGRALSADAALAAGLIDRIATLEDTLARASSAKPVASPRAALESPPLATTQEPERATVQEPAAVIDASFAEFEQRVLALTTKRIRS